MAWRGLRRFGQRSQELVCGIMVDAGVQVFVDQMTLVHRRIVGRWICQRVEPHPFLIVMPVVGRAVLCESGSNPDCLEFLTFPNMLTRLNQALLENLRISEWKHITRCHVGSTFTVETYLITVYLLHYPKLSKYHFWY